MQECSGKRQQLCKGITSYRSNFQIKFEMDRPVKSFDNKSCHAIVFSNL
jgi:hypothetical protein